MPLVASPPYLHVNYEGRRRTLLGQWQRSVMPFEMHQGYACLLDAAQQYDCHYWLIDTTRRAAGIDATDVFWMLDVFFPQLAPRLGGTTYLAFLMAPNQLAGVLATPAIPPLPDGQNLAYYLQRFTDEAAARLWLRKCARIARSQQVR
ncbi:hypothetical protein [Hymenobacter rigui]|uniref:STAS/SEC14 domain-containing protein n=1 Tax=Hymenobacter rigui TaxID=334424 RepID=A0A428KEU2_9BACT|nr:hypothetical protein [Hymenobacter rigui]RSK44960.1 hypothetical protein EI291_20065 [Hymenobacter rigui]